MNAPWQEQDRDRALDEPRVEVHCLMHGRQYVAEQLDDAGADYSCPVCADTTATEERLTAVLDAARRAVQQTPGVTLQSGMETTAADLVVLRVLRACLRESVPDLVAMQCNQALARASTTSSSSSFSGVA